MRNIIIGTLFAIAISLSTVGCISPIDPVGPLISLGIAWMEGEAHKYYPHNSDVVYRAVKRACNKLGYVITRDDPPDDGYYYLVAGGNDRFKIKVSVVEANISRLSVRINFMGDKPYTELLYQQVDREVNVIEFDGQGSPTH